MRAPLLVLLAASLALPGCVTDGALAPQAAGAGAAWDAVRALMQGVACEDSADTRGTTPNLKQLAYLPTADEYSPAFHAELALRTDERGTFALHARVFDGGFDVLSLDDPLDPKWLSAWVPENASAGLDVKWSTDGATAIVGSTAAIQLVDVRDPAAPVQEGEWRFPTSYPNAQAHMLALHRIGNDDVVFAATQMDMGVLILRLVGEPGQRKLEPLATFAQGLNGPIGPHDQIVVDDPLAKRPLMFVANGFHGWLAADVADPAHPQLVGGAVPLDPYADYAHSVAVAYVGGKRIVSTASEVGVSALKVYDATNLLAPVLLAEWADDAKNPLAMQHDLQVLGDRLYLAHYERGVFVFNLTQAAASPPLVGTLALKPVAHYSVGDKPNSNPAAIFTDAESLDGALEAVVHHGVVFVGTVHDGLHVVGDGCLTPGDAAATSGT